MLTFYNSIQSTIKILCTILVILRYRKTKKKKTITETITVTITEITPTLPNKLFEERLN